MNLAKLESLNSQPPYDPTAIASAKRILGIDRLVLQIHDLSFPSDPDEDIGRGSPYSIGAERFLRFAAGLGFDAVQLGPQGMTDPGNRSPYDGSLFSRNPMNLPVARLAQQGRVRHSTLRVLQSERPTDKSGCTPQRWLFESYRRVAAEVASSADRDDWEATRRYLAEHEAWIIPDALYPVLCAEHGAEWWGAWHGTSQGKFDQRLFAPDVGDYHAAGVRLAALRATYSPNIDNHALVQWLLDAEHRALRERLRALDLALYGDIQVGPSQHDAWAWQNLFLRDYRMGAPPSRTNPKGQPWGYRVLDPGQYGTFANPGPALTFLKKRLDMLLLEYDGLRVDHPHGWIDPWVYRHDAPEPFRAVQVGARLFSSPDEPDHKALHAFAIARSEQIDHARPRHADDRVCWLDDTQVARYGMLIDAIIGHAAARGRATGSLACEVLSTQPYPVARVLAHHGLGRFRVVQKARLDDPSDVYRVEQAAPEDWIMLGTHDTPSIWEAARQWRDDGMAECWARYLAPMLGIEDDAEGFVSRVSEEPGELVNALFSATLVSQARNVMVFFADLFGFKERYNEPGTVNDRNWTLRLPSDFERLYQERCRLGQALDVGKCLQRAVRARNSGMCGD